ncbi:MAG: chemotaxis-specific protein-glutamate methyltransferase CheB [Hormoscilla sp.]
MGQKIIKVLIVEDSPIVTLLLKRILASSPEIEVVGTAVNGLEALELMPKVQPDVICTDLHMSKMNGLELTQTVMATTPKPILVISASVQKENHENVFKLLEAGAVDIFPKPAAGLKSDYERAARELIGKIKILSGVSVFTHRHRQSQVNSQSQVNKLNQKTIKSPVQNDLVVREETSYDLPSALFGDRQKSYNIIAIGASTGGPQALYNICSKLPPNLPVPVICVQHISEGFLQGLVDWLAGGCKLPVRIALAGEFPKPGTIYFSPERYHLLLNDKGRFVYSHSPAEGGHRPSVTVMMKSVAQFYGKKTVGVLLTGMGKDGADGMQAIARAGGFTIAQDEETCVVFGMPKEAIALDAVQKILPISAIAPRLSRLILNS